MLFSIFKQRKSIFINGYPVIEAKIMVGWPHKETPLTEQEKNAYRYLLYWAMLQIRNDCQSRGKESWNPFKWWRQYRRSRIAGATADWLHNLAFYAAIDFRGFNTEGFWQEYESKCQRFPELSYQNYRKKYEQQLAQ